jgi:hypothetical protein
MKSFLDLPPQIRTRIYTHLILHTPLDTPSSLTTFHASDPYQRLFRHSASIAEAKIERIIHYPSRIYLSFEGLLRTNWVIRNEVKKILKSLRKENVDCRLDLIIERGSGGGNVWPSWIICPARNPTIRRLEVDVRVFGDEYNINLLGGEERHGPVVLREDFDGALAFTHAHVGRERCRTLAFAIVAVVSRFIERGARWGHVRGDISIESLVLNFVDAGQGKEKEKDDAKFLELTPTTSDRSQEGGRRSSDLTPPNSTTPPTPMDIDNDCACAEDYWDIDTLVGDTDEAMTFALGDSRPLNRVGTDNTMDDETIQAPELLRMVDLVLKPLCREEKYMLHRRQHHFSAVHLSLIRRNVRRVLIELEGKLKRRMKVVEK